MEEHKEFKRGDIAGTFVRFGSYLALVLRFTYYALAEFQKHSLHNSMVKKLYSQDREEDADDPDESKKDKEIGSMQIFNKSKPDILNDAITKRSIFTYQYARSWYLKNFDRQWLCCLRSKAKRQDHMWKEAKQKLFSEIDLLEITKKLRVCMFASDILLKPRQQKLVSFFNEYKLKEPKEDKAENVKKEQKAKNRKTQKLGQKAEDPANIEDLLEEGD